MHLMPYNHLILMKVNVDASKSFFGTSIIKCLSGGRVVYVTFTRQSVGISISITLLSITNVIPAVITYHFRRQLKSTIPMLRLGAGETLSA